MWKSHYLKLSSDSSQSKFLLGDQVFPEQPTKRRVPGDITFDCLLVGFPG